MLCISKTLLYLQESSGLVFAVHRSMGSMSVSEKYNKTTKYQVNQGQSWHVGSMEDPVLVYVNYHPFYTIPTRMRSPIKCSWTRLLLSRCTSFLYQTHTCILFILEGTIYTTMFLEICLKIQCHWKELIFNIHHALNTRKNSAFIGQLHPCSILVFYYLITSFVFLCYPNYFRVSM